MKMFIVVRDTDSVLVRIMRNKSDNTYSFVNLTKDHICSCKFSSVEDAIRDMDRLKDEGKIVDYYEVFQKWGE